MENLKFIKLAKERFGDKVWCGKINIKNNSETQDYFGFSKESIENYPEHVWCPTNKCPNCDAELLGLSSSFQWGIQHGYGTCTNCNKVEFKYYHYIDDKKPPLQAFAVVGF